MSGFHIQAINKKNKMVEHEFRSMLEAQAFGFDPACISRCVRGLRASHKNYVWVMNPVQPISKKGKAYELIYRLVDKLIDHSLDYYEIALVKEAQEFINVDLVS